MFDFYESSRELFSPRNLVPPLLLGMCQYLTESLAFALIVAGFGVPLTWELLLQATFISGVAAAVGALSGAPNGAAVTEISVTLLLVATVGSQHIEFTIAAAATAALLQGFFHKWLRVIAGLAVGFVFRRRLFPATIEAAVVELDREVTGEFVAPSVEGQAAPPAALIPASSAVPPICEATNVGTVFDDHSRNHTCRCPVAQSCEPGLRPPPE
jgi:hypothetical protein